MKKINVFLYFYKNKNIKNIVDMLNKTSSKNVNIFFDIYDQDNENKVNQYINLKNIRYNHIFWDKMFGISYYRNRSLNNEFDYFLEIKNINFIKENWDKELINIHEDNILYSGKNKIDMNFLFTDKKNSLFLKDLYDLKYYGQDILLLYLTYKNKLNIKNIDDSFISFNTDTILSSDYIPYSLYHNYNKTISLIKSDLEFVSYCNSNNIDLSSYKLKGGQADDLNYFEFKYNIDYKESEKFKNTIKTLKIEKVE
jgi:hypothetical protein